MLLRMYSGSSIQVKRTLESDVVKGVTWHMMSRLVLFQRKIPYLHPLQYPLPEIAFFLIILAFLSECISCVIGTG